jgi:hypothetical protein
MVSPDIEELHRFAARLGLKRAWFQGQGAVPHYDLTAGIRARAVRLGAVEVARRDWRAIFDPIREAWVKERAARKESNNDESKPDET